MTIFINSPPAHAIDDLHEGTIQPFACGPSTAEIIDEPDKAVAIGSTGKAIRLTNKANADCGYVLFDLPEKYYLIDSGFLENSNNPRKFNALKIVFADYSLAEKYADSFTVRMCYKPQFGSPDLISVDVPLKNFNRDNRTFWATREVIFGSRPGVTDLRKLSLIMTKPGTVVVGAIRWAAELDPTRRRAFVPKAIVLQNAGCDAGRPCRPQVGEVLEAKRAEILEKLPARPTRGIPTRLTLPSR